MQDIFGQFFRGKKFLVMGLGLLGGGAAATKWLLKHGAKVTATDLRSPQDLRSSLAKLPKTSPNLQFVLGRHRREDFRTHDVIVVNPAVPRENPYLTIAKEHGKRFENEASLFFRFARNPLIAVTGTRGKTTTVNWLAHILQKRFSATIATGNSAEHPMLEVVDRLNGRDPVVVELSSWHLELLPEAGRGPDIAIITNVLCDHLNRYRNMHDYARAKANIFLGQQKGAHFILNADNPWTPFFKGMVKHSEMWLVGSRPFRSGMKGLFLHNSMCLWRFQGKTKKLFSLKHIADVWGKHNVMNFLIASLAAHLVGVDWHDIEGASRSLPLVRFRQEVVWQRKGLTIVNDTVATSPDATIAALHRFSGKGDELVLITGGTDKNLRFEEWAKCVKRAVKPHNLILLDGSATERMMQALGHVRFAPKGITISPLSTLEECVTLALTRAKAGSRAHLILFSPSAASFEKFQDEFDRGEQFNRLIHELIKNY